jgi:hypothetical protein
VNAPKTAATNDDRSMSDDEEHEGIEFHYEKTGTHQFVGFGMGLQYPWGLGVWVWVWVTMSIPLTHIYPPVYNIIINL